MVIRGEHKTNDHSQSLQRSFTRRLTLPKYVNKDAIQCNINEKGQMEIIAPKLEAIEPLKSHNISIGFKPSSEQIENNKKSHLKDQK